MSFRQFISLSVLALGCVGVLSAAEPRDMSVSPARRDDAYRLSLNGVTVATYYIDNKFAKPFLFRLIAPGGVLVSRSWPIEPTAGVSRDHVHQKSAWFTHGEMTLENAGGEPSKPIDFWAEGPGHGKIVVTGGELPRPGRRLPSWDEWQGPDGMKILSETRSIALFSVADGRLIVFETDLHAEFGPVQFGDTKEGAFGLRVDDQLRVGDKGKINPKSRISNADGKEGEKACWGHLSNWCDYSGETDGKAVGIAIFDDPANKPRSCWHVRDYGLMAANPFGRAKSGFPAMRGRTDVVRLGKGEHLKLRYGLFLHTADAAGGKVAEAFERFVKLKD